MAYRRYLVGRFSISLVNARDNDATVLAGDPRAGGNMPPITVTSGQADRVVRPGTTQTAIQFLHECSGSNKSCDKERRLQCPAIRTKRAQGLSTETEYNTSNVVRSYTTVLADSLQFNPISWATLPASRENLPTLKVFEKGTIPMSSMACSGVIPLLSSTCMGRSYG